jgi:ADP-ribose pyrophosphatase
MGKQFESWKTLLSEELFSTPWMSVIHKQFELPGGKKGNYFHVHTNGSAMAIPVLDDGTIVLVKQYRYLVDEASIELPCGGIKSGQNDLEAARTELIEETGYDCRKIKRVGRFMPYNGLSDEFCAVFIARALMKVPPAPDETEQIEVVTATPAEIDRMIEKGKIVDGMTIAGWLLARRHLK